MADRYGVEYDGEQIKDDGKFSPYERSVYENVLSKQFSGCFFISIHTNAVDNAPDVSGASIDWYSGNPYSEDLAGFSENLAKMLSLHPGTTLKIYEDSYEEAYIVTKYADIPSVLIELGYGTNSADARNLCSSIWIHEFMSSVADALETHFNQKS